MLNLADTLREHGIQPSAQRVASGIVRDLFLEDADRHWERVQAHNEDELKPTRYFVPLEKRKPYWARLEQLVHVSSRGVSALRHSELQELGLLSHLHYDPPAMRRTLLHRPADLVHYKDNLRSEIENCEADRGRSYAVV